MTTKAQIINISIIATSDYAYKLVGNTAIAKIHSVYNKTINLLINNDIFSLQPKGSLLSPISLIADLSVSQFKDFALNPEECYQLNLDYRNCEFFCSKLTACIPNENDIITCAQMSKQILQSTSTKGLNRLLQESGQSQDLLLTAFQNYLIQANHFYQIQDYSKVIDTLTKLIGLGIGLTPSGDDFLCGMLATFQHFNQTETLFYQSLVTQIKEKLNRTNAISSRFLACALEQQFSAAMLTFFAQVHHENKMKINELGRLFEEIGHSSGMDTLFGIYYTCEWLLKAEQGCNKPI